MSATSHSLPASLPRRYCPHSNDGGANASVLYEEWFHCTDLGTQLVPVIARFHASEAKATGVPAG